MQTDTETNALLNVRLSLAVTPGLTIINPSGKAHAVPQLPTTDAASFACDLEAALPYGRLSHALDVFLRGKRLQLSEGLIRQHVILDGCKLYPGVQHQLVAEVPFSGSFSGTFYITGSPLYNPQARRIELQQVGYDLKTTSLFLKGAKWLFGNLILEEIKKYTAVDLSPFYSTVSARISALLNQQWAKGIEASGSVTDIAVTNIAAQKQQLLIRARCTGSLHVIVSGLELTF